MWSRRSARKRVNGYDLLVMSNPFTRGLEVMRDAVAKVTKKLPCDVLLVMPGRAVIAQAAEYFQPDSRVSPQSGKDRNGSRPS